MKNKFSSIKENLLKSIHEKFFDFVSLLL